MKTKTLPRISLAIAWMLFSLYSCTPSPEEAASCAEAAATLIYEGKHVEGEARMCACMRNPHVDSVDAIERRMTARFAMHQDSACLEDLQWLAHSPKLPCWEHVNAKFSISGMALHRRRDTAAAIASYRDGMAQAESCGEHQLAAEVLPELGRLLRLRGELHEARAVLLRGLQGPLKRPDDIALLELMEVELSQGHGESCLDLFTKLVRPDTLQADQDYARARAYLQLQVRDSVCPVLLRAAQAGNWKADSAYFNRCVKQP